MWHHRGVALSVVAVVLAACSEPAAIDPDDLVLSFQASPDTMRAGGQIVAQLTILNAGSDAIALETNDGCLGRARVLAWDEDPSAFHVASDSCADTASTVIIAPGESLARRRTVRAWVRDTALGYDTLPPLPGRYTMRLETAAPLPDLDAPFTVWPSGYYWGWRRCGFVTPTAVDSIVVSVDAGKVFYGFFTKPYKVCNFTSSDISLREVGTGGSVNGVRLWEGWFGIGQIVQRQTAEGWEGDSGYLVVYELPVMLRPNECLQAWNPLYRVTPGTYRVGVRLRTGWAYSDPVVVP
ncbi:MAG: hypothetical protein JSW71_02575 [Gemmatimonadota bacterium]|nr:MAG: hypothetical protein JSW71_02575 [Gemmatimonadota bacterium]